jgi:hypothetical protein
LTKRQPDDLEADLSAYLDGELSEQRTREVERWLAESEPARQMLEELRAVSGRLAGLPRLAAPEQLAASMSAHAQRRLLLNRLTTTRRSQGFRLLAQMSAAAAALVACVLVGWQVLDWRGESGPSQAKLRGEAQPGQPTPIEHVSARQQDEKFAARAPFRQAEEDESAGVSAAPRPPAGWGRSRGSAGEPEAAEIQQPYELGAPYAEQPGPSVNVWVATANDEEYVRTATVLAGWAQRDGKPPGPGPGELKAEPAEVARDRVAWRRGASPWHPSEVPVPVPPADEPSATPGAAASNGLAQQPIEYAYQVLATELPIRIDELASNVAQPSQVRVQMNFDAANSRNVLLDAGQRALLEQARLLDSGQVAAGRQLARQVALATCPASPERPAEAGEAQAESLDTAAAGPAYTPEGRPAAGGTKLARRTAGVGPQVTTSPDKSRAESEMASKDRIGAAGRQRGGLPPEPSQPGLMEQALGLMFQGARGADRRAGPAWDVVAATRPVIEQVTFRVLLLPPPEGRAGVSPAAGQDARAPHAIPPETARTANPATLPSPDQIRPERR